MEAVDMTATLAPHHIPGYAGIPEYRPGAMICTGMDRPLWPRQWRLFRDGYFTYRVGVIERVTAAAGMQAAVTAAMQAQLSAETARLQAAVLTAFRLKPWHVGLAPKPRLRLGEYHRRQQARVKRRKR